MIIKVIVSQDELNEMLLDHIEFEQYIIDTLDELGPLGLPGYNVEIEVK